MNTHGQMKNFLKSLPISNQPTFGMWFRDDDPAVGKRW